MIAESTIRDNSYIFIETGVLATINYLEAFELGISRRRVRDLFLKYSLRSGISVRSIKQVFHELGISSHEYEVIDIGLLKKLTNPFITLLVTKGKLEFVCVVGISQNTVIYYNEFSILETVEIGEFSGQWKNLVIVADPREAVEDNETVKLQNAMAESFRNSIQIIDGFIADELCDEIISYCDLHGVFEPSKVSRHDIMEDEEGQVSEHRTSESANLKAIESLPGMNNVFTRLSELLNVPRARFETAQCVKYQPCSYFGPHFDSGPEFTTPRKFTAIFYLNDDFNAGETYFPELKYLVTPVKGRALIFDGLLSNNLDCNPFSLHAGLPVKTGQKYICTIWSRTHDEF